MVHQQVCELGHDSLFDLTFKAKCIFGIAVEDLFVTIAHPAFWISMEA